jgi:hypothetical protein
MRNENSYRLELTLDAFDGADNDPPAVKGAARTHPSGEGGGAAARHAKTWLESISLPAEVCPKGAPDSTG